MTRLEGMGSGNRSGPEQGRLNRYRDWMTTHVEPHFLDLISCGGFWASDRPRWSLSRTSSDGLLQVGRMCLFPSVVDGRQIILTTCTHGTNITWDIALERGYTLMPKPYTGYIPPLLQPPPWTRIALRAWRSRAQHTGLLTAFRAERAKAIQDARRENKRRRADHESAKRQWQEKRDHAAQAFRLRHARTQRSERP